MVVLIIDSTSSILQIGLCNNNKVINKRLDSNSNHSKTALKAIDEVLEEFNLTVSNVDQIIVNVGPGSFTGIRIGVALAKSLGYSLNIPVIPINSLLQNVIGYEQEYLISLIDARHNNCYCAIYDNEYNVVLKEQFMSYDELFDIASKLEGNYLLIGAPDKVDHNVRVANFDIAKIIDYSKSLPIPVIHNVNPLYLKKTAAEIQKEEVAR